MTDISDTELKLMLSALEGVEDYPIRVKNGRIIAIWDEEPWITWSNTGYF